MAQDAKLNYKHYPRSVSWQVASVLNPSLQNFVPASQESKRARDRRDRSDAAAAAATSDQGVHSSSNGIAASKSWQEEESCLPLPPQYVSPSALCKAMPKYMRVKARPGQMLHTKPTTVTMTNSTTSWSPRIHNNLPFSPHYDLAFGSPRSSNSSAKLTPRSDPESPKQATVASEAANQKAIKLASDAACSPASPAQSPDLQQPGAALVTAAAARAASESTTPPGSAPHQNTPQTRATSGSRSSRPHSPSNSRRHSGAQSPRIRSAATSPMFPCPAAAAAAAAGGSSRGQAMDATSLQMKLNSIIAHHPELLQRAVPQMQSAAQGSPLSPANSSMGRESGHDQGHASGHGHACYASPPVALPPTPPTSWPQNAHLRRARNAAQAQEPTLEMYQKISPHTYATNTVWNDRRDQDSRDRDPTQRRRSILIRSN